MTTTDMFSGVREGSKPSSRVLAPPGGGGSDIFGTGLGSTPPAPRPEGRGCQGNQRNQSSILGGGDDTPEQANPQRRKENTGSNIFGAPDPKPESPAKKEDEEDDEEGEGKNNNEEKASPAKPRAGVNPITGEAYGEQKPNANVHTSIKTRQPPGGASSGLW